MLRITAKCVLKKEKRASLVLGATVPGQNQDTTTRLHLKRLSSLTLVSRICELCELYVSYHIIMAKIPHTKIKKNHLNLPFQMSFSLKPSLKPADQLIQMSLWTT